MATSLVAIPSAQESPFLCLPGEIRNLIYDLTTETDTISLKYSFIYRKKTAPVPYSREHNSKFFALAQVCSAIRTEYLSIYRARTAFHINLLDVDRYINAYVVPPGTDMEQAVGRLIISFGKQSERMVASSFNALPLIRLVGAAAHLKVAIELQDVDYRANGQPVLNGFFEKLLNPSRFNKYLQEAMVAVKIFSGKWGPLSIIFHVKPMFMEDWMGFWSNKDYMVFDEAEEGLELWGSRLGLDLSNELKHYIDFSIH